MKTGSTTLISLMCLGIVDMVIPVPIIALILIYVVFKKPPWFRDIVRDIYGP